MQIYYKYIHLYIERDVNLNAFKHEDLDIIYKL